MTDSEPTAGLEWRRGRVIPWRELTFRQDPAGGPGGQHANRSSTRVTLTWRPLDSSGLREEERARIRAEWAPRLSASGVLRVRSGEERSARRNRERCLESLAALLRETLAPRRSRRPTRPTAASRERRFEGKRRQARRKAARRPPRED